MKKPFFRKQSATWCVWLDNGKLKTLGKDPHGATRKNPPREILDIWRKLEGGAPAVKDMTIAQVAEKYLIYLTHPSSNKVAREHLGWFMAFVGKGMKVSALRVHHLTDYLKTKPNWSQSMQSTAVGRITAALNHAVAEGYIEEHKVRFHRGRKPTTTRRQTIPGEEHWARLLNGANPRLRLILEALKGTGCRPGELRDLTIDKVDLEERVIRVRNKTAKQTGKKEREVYLSRPMVEIIREAIAGREAGAVFLNNWGGPWDQDSLGAAILRLRNRLGLPKDVIAYSLRHAWASRAVNDTDANVALVARQLGHTNLSMMMRVYLHESPEAMRRTVDKISGEQ